MWGIGNMESRETTVCLTTLYSIALKQATESCDAYAALLQLQNTIKPIPVTLDVYKDEEDTLHGLEKLGVDLRYKFPQHDLTTKTFFAEVGALLQEAKAGMEESDAGRVVAAYERLQAAKEEARQAVEPTPAAGGADGAEAEKKAKTKKTKSKQPPTAADAAAVAAPGFALAASADNETAVLTTLRPSPSLETESAGEGYAGRVDTSAVSASQHASFLADVMKLVDRLRGAETPPTPAEYFATGLAVHELGDGVELPRLYLPLYAPGQHKYQSFVFVTDAGPGHLETTVQDKELLRRGIVVHIEHIERSASSDRSLVEAYRLPSHVTAATVRMHVGDLAPTSCFIGRPTFEGMGFASQWPHDGSGRPFEQMGKAYFRSTDGLNAPDFYFDVTLLKAVHNTASACSAMFASGIVDCKIAIENMTDQQATVFMNGVVANVRRDRETQFLSAAFNINRPLFSDAANRSFRKPTEAEAAQMTAEQYDKEVKGFIDLAVRVAAEGNFDKVTLDGASERKGPSVPIVEQLPHHLMVYFMHAAHSSGLVTYLSAGLNPANLHKAVFTGVDGMGIGLALHLLSEDEPGVVGALDIAKINSVLDKRDTAEADVVARAAKLLAGLDYLSAGVALSEQQALMRRQLWAALYQVVAGDDYSAVQAAVEGTHIDIEAQLKALRPCTQEAGDDDEEGLRPLGRVQLWADKLLENWGSSDNDAYEAVVAEKYGLKKAQVGNWADQVKKFVSAKSVQPLRRLLVKRTESRRKPASSGAVEECAAAAAAAADKDSGSMAATATATDATSSASPDTRKTAVTLTAAQTAVTCDDNTNYYGRVFLGESSLPEGMTESDLVHYNAMLIEPRVYVPFKTERDELYTTAELLRDDTNIYNWYKFYEHGTQDRVMMAIHDGVVLDLLKRKYGSRKQVGIMGGHAMLRNQTEFRDIAHLCHQLAKNGYVCASGGGPGAMEACNLGAHFAVYSSEDLDKALTVMGRYPYFEAAKNPKPSAEDAALGIGDVDDMLAYILRVWPGDEANEMSLGVPTWLYGHEPPNVFCRFQAKFFSNAVREDVLVLTCNCGIVYAPGSAGTRTEIAQFAVPQTYSKETGKDFSKPMVFYGNFWTENTVYPTYLNLALREKIGFPKPWLHYSNKMYQTAKTAEILQIVDNFAALYYPGGDPRHGSVPVVLGQEEVPAAKTWGPVKERGHQVSRSDDIKYAKCMAAYRAVDEWLVRDGMTIGIGSGTTVEYAIDRVAQIVDEKKWKVLCVPTSNTVSKYMERYADLLRVEDFLTCTAELEFAVDGADETDDFLRLIKGGGGALLNENVVAQSARHYVVVADWRKRSHQLGTTYKSVPVEVMPTSWKHAQSRINRLLMSESACQLRVVKTEAPKGTDPSKVPATPFVTENGNYILDVATTSKDLAEDLLYYELTNVAGVAQVGLFRRKTTIAYFGMPYSKAAGAGSFEDGLRNVVVRERVSTTEFLVSQERQQQAVQAILDAVARQRSQSPVVLLDLDLTALMPYRRAISGLVFAGRDWGVPELETFVHDRVGIIPGYTVEAWDEWLQLDAVKAITERYPGLPWKGDPAVTFATKGDAGATVHSSFHAAFWADPRATEKGGVSKRDCLRPDPLAMADDIPTEGLLDLEERVHACGGKLVFFSGRWESWHVDMSVSPLRSIGLRHGVNLVIGNPGHGQVSDSDAKKKLLEQVNAKYGLPVAYVDDRYTNLEPVAQSGKVSSDFVGVISCIPGYTAAPVYRQHPEYLALSNFFLHRPAPRIPLQFGAEKKRLEEVAPAATATATVTTAVPLSVPAAAVHDDKPKQKRLSLDERVLQETVRVGTFNVENLFRRFLFNRNFDTPDDGFTFSDAHFSIMDDEEKRITAEAILAVDADVLALQEVESLDLLDKLNSEHLGEMYKYRMLVQGNDMRGINVAIMSRYPFAAVNSARFAATEDADGVKADLLFAESGVSHAHRVFSRDCLIVKVTPFGKETMTLYINHFKSMSGGRERTRAKRQLQCERVAAMLERDHGTTIDGNVIVMGDFNEYEDDESGTLPLVRHPHLHNIVKTRLPEEDQWTHYWASGKSYSQLDYLLLSDSLNKRTEGINPYIERRGQPWRAGKYDGPRFENVGQNRPKASDHCPVTIDIPLGSTSPTSRPH
eukprot:TRINITY_DN23_c0_g1_i4.p1 TRINITY_DN23_c0_g1~~TRINITY_DN23_c0_g1_i4.p1  ORF type:complete len:2139 (+),score=1003.49 TRINITY_DN23_c0_g1_i4:111-6527(+)